MLDDRKDATMSTRPLLYCGLLAPMALVVGVLVEDATRPGYSPWRHAVSQLSLGPGWPVNLALFLLGAVGLLSLAIALPRALPTPDRPRWTPRLVATAGTALALRRSSRSTPAWDTRPASRSSITGRDWSTASWVPSCSPPWRPPRSPWPATCGGASSGHRGGPTTSRPAWSSRSPTPSPWCFPASTRPGYGPTHQVGSPSGSR